MTTWDAWAARRPEPVVTHLDCGAAGRASTATLEAVAAHLQREAEVGAYVAEAEVAAVVDQLRADLGTLVGVEAEGVGLTAAARSGLRMLLECWALPDGGTVGIAPSEWGPNLQLFMQRGLTAQLLPVDHDGRLDLDTFGTLLRREPPSLVHLDAVSAHRGLRQPVTEAARLCREAGVPLWVDAAQAVGQTTDLHADAVYGTSRKWLTGPRGVGFLAVDRASWPALSVPRRVDAPDVLLPVPLLTVGEANVAGRVGLAAAVREYLADGPEQVGRRLDEVGEQTREALADTGGWEVLAGQVGPITALRPTAGQDVVQVRERLLAEHRIVTTATLQWRAPLEPVDGWLRVSPHVDLAEADLVALVRALHDA